MKKPNIVFIFSDQQHGRAVGACDPSFATPTLDALASESTVFSHAYCTCPQCSPSRASILTGLYPHRTSVQGNVGAAGGNPLEMPTIAPRLQAAGYRTAYFGKWHLGKKAIATEGWDEEFGVIGPETTDDDEVTRCAVRFLGARQADTDQRPFALFLSYNNPHDIYRFARGTRVDHTDTHLEPHHNLDDLTDKPRVQRQFMNEDQGRIMAVASDDDWRAYRALYREMTRRYDTEVGTVVRAMKRLSLLDATFLFVTSDHGDMDGAHSLVFKGPFMYDQLMHVPLMIRPPKILGYPAQRLIDELVLNTDLVPTLLDIATGQSAVGDGTSLLPFLSGNGKAPRREFVIGQYYGKQRWVNPIRMLRSHRWKLTRYADGATELYDLVADPHELSNLALRKEHGHTLRELNSALDRWMCANEDPFPGQSPTTRQGELL